MTPKFMARGDGPTRDSHGGESRQPTARMASSPSMIKSLKTACRREGQRDIAHAMRVLRSSAFALRR